MVIQMGFNGVMTLNIPGSYKHCYNSTYRGYNGYNSPMHKAVYRGSDSISIYRGSDSISNW